MSKKGYKLTEEHKRKIVKARKKNNSYPAKNKEEWKEKVSKDNHWNWKDGSAVRKGRIAMERHLCRILDSDEIVHHINRNRADNRLENLQLLSRSEHGKIHGGEANV